MFPGSRPSNLFTIEFTRQTQQVRKPASWPFIFMKTIRMIRFAALGLILAAVITQAQTAKISVAVDQPGHKVSPALWGIFFEDINLSADGGIYPELVRNRSFEDAETPENWKFTSTSGTSSAEISTASYSGRSTTPPLNPLNRRSLRVRIDGAFTLENAGY
jgi:hypothetical protein